MREKVYCLCCVAAAGIHVGSSQFITRRHARRRRSEDGFYVGGTKTEPLKAPFPPPFPKKGNPDSCTPSSQTQVQRLLSPFFHYICSASVCTMTVKAHFFAIQNFSTTFLSEPQHRSSSSYSSFSWSVNWKRGSGNQRDRWKKKFRTLSSRFSQLSPPLLDLQSECPPPPTPSPLFRVFSATSRRNNSPLSFPILFASIEQRRRRHWPKSSVSPAMRATTTG